MAVLPLIEAPHPTLKTPAEPVGAVDAHLRRLVEDMFETMYKAPGIGLAAPQVGVLSRLFVTDIADRKRGEEARPMVLINPEVTWSSDELTTVEEGCLSLPLQFAEVVRPKAVRVRYRDFDDRTHEIDADDLLARCLQHEIDHLDGVLFTDHLSALKRSMIMRKLAKAKRGKS